MVTDNRASVASRGAGSEAESRFLDHLACALMLIAEELAKEELSAKMDVDEQL
jgi:hypothetical protein